MENLRKISKMLGAACVAALLVCLHACGGSGPGEGVLRILVTNDDGVMGEGMDVLIEALSENPNNILVICAPDGNRSGSGDRTGPSPACGDLTVTPSTTPSGRAATAINGCPADAVNYALDNIYAPGQMPHVVISGSNEGQNVGEQIALQISGTVGAARTAGRRGIPALAVSQGRPMPGHEYDYEVGVEAVIDWLAENRRRLQRRDEVPTFIESINAPSCSDGAPRGLLVGLPLAEDITGFIDFQDCTSTLEDPRDDIEALNNGFITLTRVPVD